jgi:hypothetical protein
MSAKVTEATLAEAIARRAAALPGVDTLVYQCPTHGFFFAAATPEAWRWLTGGRIKCGDCGRTGTYRPDLSPEVTR